MFDFLLFLSVIIFAFKPDIINILEVESIKKISNIILLIDMVILLYKLDGKLKLNGLKCVKIAVLFWCFCLIPTIIYFQNIVGIGSLMLKTSVLGLMCYYATKDKEKFSKLLLASVIVFVGELAVNLLCMFILPNGSFLEPSRNMSGEWVYTYFLGSKNNFTTFALSGISLVGLWERDKKKKAGILSIIVTVICFISMYKVRCSVGIILMALMFMSLIITSYVKIVFKETENILKIVPLFVLMVAVVSLAMLNTETLQMITHSRWLIWVEAVKLFIKKPILGYGMQSDHDLIWLYNSYRYSHNEVLEVLLYGGILALSIYIWFLKSSVDYVKSGTKSIRINLFVYLVFYMIAQIFEAKFTSINLFFIIFVHVYYVRLQYGQDWVKHEL